MSFAYGSGTWQPHSTAEHAADLLANINSILSAGNVQVNGKLVQFTASIANVVWILCLAVGAMRALLDQILFAASKMFSVSEASDAQIMACLPLAGTSLIPGEYSLVTVLVTATGAGDAVIQTNDLLPFGTICNFKVLVGATVPAGTGVSFLCESDTIGPIAAAPHTVTAFKVNHANVASVDNPLAAVLGRYAETVQQVRQRLLQGNIADVGLDGTKRALKGIQGITTASIYFNFDTVNNLLVPGGIVIPPRYAYVVLQGLDLTGTSAAGAYARRMTAPTIGAQSQMFVTQSGQNFPVYFDYAAGASVYVTVYYDPDSITASGFQVSIQNIIAALVVEIGQRVTVAMILQALVDFPYALITGAQVSLDAVAWSNEVEIPANKIAVFYPGNITVTAEP